MQSSDRNQLQADPAQADKFKEAARQIEADEDEAHWEARLKAIARQKPKGDEKDDSTQA